MKSTSKENSKTTLDNRDDLLKKIEDNTNKIDKMISDAIDEEFIDRKNPSWRPYRDALGKAIQGLEKEIKKTPQGQCDNYIKKLQKIANKLNIQPDIFDTLTSNLEKLKNAPAQNQENPAEDKGNTLQSRSPSQLSQTAAKIKSDIDDAIFLMSEWGFKYDKYSSKISEIKELANKLYAVMSRPAPKGGYAKACEGIIKENLKALGDEKEIKSLMSQIKNLDRKTREVTFGNVMSYYKGQENPKISEVNFGDEVKEIKKKGKQKKEISPSKKIKNILLILEWEILYAKDHLKSQRLTNKDWETDARTLYENIRHANKSVVNFEKKLSLRASNQIDGQTLEKEWKALDEAIQTVIGGMPGLIEKTNKLTKKGEAPLLSTKASGLGALLKNIHELKERPILAMNEKQKTASTQPSVPPAKLSHMISKANTRPSGFTAGRREWSEPAKAVFIVSDSCAPLKACVDKLKEGHTDDRKKQIKDHALLAIEVFEKDYNFTKFSTDLKKLISQSEKTTGGKLHFGDSDTTKTLKDLLKITTERHDGLEKKLSASRPMKPAKLDLPSESSKTKDAGYTAEEPPTAMRMGRRSA